MLGEPACHLGRRYGCRQNLACHPSSYRPNNRHLPATVKANWRREILRERPDARVLSGTVRSTIEPDVDFIILNYDIADAWQDYLIAWRPDTCICDEAHTCRNRKTARFQATKQIIWACNRRYLLTGTPIVKQHRGYVTARLPPSWSRRGKQPPSDCAPRRHEAKPCG